MKVSAIISFSTQKQTARRWARDLIGKGWPIMMATPFILSGGISPEDAEEIKSFKHPKFAGIDINSRFEIEPAYKDIEMIKSFIKQIR